MRERACGKESTRGPEAMDRRLLPAVFLLTCFLPSSFPLFGDAPPQGRRGSVVLPPLLRIRGRGGWTILRIRGGCTDVDEGCHVGPARGMTKGGEDDAWSDYNERQMRSLAQDFRSSQEQGDAMRRQTESLAQDARTMQGHAREMDGSKARIDKDRGKAPWMKEVERKRLEEVLMESAIEEDDEEEDNLAQMVMDHASRHRGRKGERSRRLDGRRETSTPVRGEGRGGDTTPDGERLERLRMELEELEAAAGAGQHSPKGERRESRNAKPTASAGGAVVDGDDVDEDQALAEELNDGVWGALSSFSVSEQGEDKYDNELRTQPTDSRKARAIARQEEDLERGMPALVKSMAVEYLEAGYVRYQCSFCPEDFEGASSYMATWRHVWSNHQNFLLCDNVAEEAARVQDERLQKRMREDRERDEGKKLAKKQQREIMWARQRESEKLKAQQKEKKMEQWAWGQQKKIEQRRDVKEHKKAVLKGALRFHPKWGYVPNDMKPQRFGNRLNGKRRKKFHY